jgi:hypothetical protein
MSTRAFSDIVLLKRHPPAPGDIRGAGREAVYSGNAASNRAFQMNRTKKDILRDAARH